MLGSARASGKGAAAQLDCRRQQPRSGFLFRSVQVSWPDCQQKLDWHPVEPCRQRTRFIVQCPPRQGFGHSTPQARFQSALTNRTIALPVAVMQ